MFHMIFQSSDGYKKSRYQFLAIQPKDGLVKSMVMVFHFNNQKGLIHIHSRVENCLKVCLMEVHQEEDHMIETHLEDHHLIHMLDFRDGWHLIQ
jgi:hypothetical protein